MNELPVPMPMPMPTPGTSERPLIMAVL